MATKSTVFLREKSGKKQWIKSAVFADNLNNGKEGEVSSFPKIGNLTQ